MTNPTHDLALARAERDAWQRTCEELHRTIAGRDVEIEAHLGRCEAADQRARSLDAALTAERETSRGLVAQVDTWRDTWARVETIVDEAFGPFPVLTVYDTICAMERGIHDGIRAAQELAAIRDLVAPGNPQGTVVDAVRALRAARDAAIARAEKAEAEAYKAIDTVGNGCGVSDIMSAPGSAYVLPSPDRAEELTAAIYGDSFSELRVTDRMSMVRRTQAALASIASAEKAEADLRKAVDAPRLAARKTPTVVASHGAVDLVRTASGEWGVRWRLEDVDDGATDTAWHLTEADARADFRDDTGTVSCESCARFIEHDDAHVDADGIYTCADETACSAAIRAKESAK